MFSADPTNLLFAPLAGFVGGTIRGYSGFGFGMAAVPILILGKDPIIAVPAVMLHEMAVGLFSLSHARKSASLPSFKFLAIGSLAGTPAGLSMLALVPASTMRPIIGATILTSVLVLWWLPALRLRLNGVRLCVTGLISGVLNGLLAASGPPLVVLLLASDLSPAQTRSTLVVFITFSAFLAVVISTLSGFMTWNVLQITLWMIPGVFIGTRFGGYLFTTLPTLRYRRNSLVMLFLISLFALGLSLNQANTAYLN